MAKGKWLAAALLGAAAAGAVYTGKKLTETAVNMEEEMNSSGASHKLLVKKGGRDIVLKEGELSKGGAIGVLCGGLNYDMSRCTIEDGAQLDIRVCMSGANLIIPAGTKLILNAQAGKAFFFSGPQAEEKADGPTLLINATGTMGSLNVRYPSEEDREEEFDDLDEFDKTRDVRPSGAPDPFRLDPHSVVPTDPVDSTILNARSMESAVGCTATGLLDFDNPSAGPEAVISSEPAAIEYKREEDGEAAEDPHETSEEVAEDPVG